MATYRIKETIEAEQYDGSPASVERIMDMLGRTSGIMNTSEGYVLIDGIRVDKSFFVVKISKSNWMPVSEQLFNSRYEKVD